MINADHSEPILGCVYHLIKAGPKQSVNCILVENIYYSPMGLKWRNYHFKKIRTEKFVNRGAKIQNLSKKQAKFQLAPLFPEI